MINSILEPRAEYVTVAAQELCIEYLERRGEGMVVVYLHGLGSAKEDFEPAAHSHALARCRLISLDFPGCGGSTYPATQALTMTDLVLLLRGFLGQVGCEAPVLVGHSMGGLVDCNHRF